MPPNAAPRPFAAPCLISGAVTAVARVRETLFGQGRDSTRSDATGNAGTCELFHDMILEHKWLIKYALINGLVDLFSMSEPVPSKRPRAGDRSLPAVASASTKKIMDDF